MFPRVLLVLCVLARVLQMLCVVAMVLLVLRVVARVLLDLSIYLAGHKCALLNGYNDKLRDMVCDHKHLFFHQAIQLN